MELKTAAELCKDIEVRKNNEHLPFVESIIEEMKFSGTFIVTEEESCNSYKNRNLVATILRKHPFYQDVINQKVLDKLVELGYKYKFGTTQIMTLSERYTFWGGCSLGTLDEVVHTVSCITFSAF